MRKVFVIGIGTGNPDYVTVQAINALNEVDVAARDPLRLSRMGVGSTGRYTLGTPSTLVSELLTPAASWRRYSASSFIISRVTCSISCWLITHLSQK